MERCPVCNARVKADSACYRCGTDLSELLSIQAQAAVLEQQAVARLSAGDPAGAYQALSQALALERNPSRLALLEFSKRELLAAQSRVFEQLLR